MVGGIAGLQALSPNIAPGPPDPAATNSVIGAAAEGMNFGVRCQSAELSSAAVSPWVSAAEVADVVTGNGGC